MKICIFGTGDISDVFLASIENIKVVEVTGVYSRNKNKADQFSKKHGIKNSYDNISDALNSECDIVYIALPNSLHYSTAKLVLNAKKHAIIEKPITSNMNELNILIQTAHQNKVKVFEVNRIIYSKHLDKMKHLLFEIEPVRLVQMSFCKISRKYAQYLSGETPNVFSLEFSGGALYDLGIYPIHLAITLFGNPLNVDYICKKLSSGVDGCGCLILDYDNFLVNITISKISQGHNFVEIQGENGTVVSDSAPSLLSNLRLLKNEVNNDLSLGGSNNPFSQFMEKCLTIISDNNDTEYQLLINQSINAMNVLEEARKKASIVFESDSHFK